MDSEVQDQDKDREDGYIQGTHRVPYRRGHSPQTEVGHPKVHSMILMEHKRTSIHPYVRADLKDAQGVKLEVFLDVVFGLTLADLNTWVSIINKQEWYKDGILSRNLKAFCTAREENDRYEPLAAITNRVMEMARGELPGVPDSYPIDDICIECNDPMTVQTIAAHGELGAIRKPDLLILRKVHAANLRPTNNRDKAMGVKWVQDIMNWELKGNKDLSKALSAFLEDRTQGKTSPDASICADSPAAPPRKRTTKARPKFPPTRRTRRQRSTKPAIESHGMATAGPSDVASRPGEKHRIEHNLLDDVRKTTNPLGGDVARCTSLDASSFAAKEASVQAGSYALETLACTFGTRLFCVNISMENDRMYFWYYDACGLVCTIEGVSLIDDFEKAAAIFVGLACCTPERLGALPPIFKPPRSAPYPENWPPEDLSRHTLTLKHPSGEGKVKVTFKESVFTQYALTGRRTFVYTIKTSPALATGGLIMKLSYQMDTKTDEQEIVKKARDAGVGHLPEIHLSNDLWKMSDGVRRIFLEKGGVGYEDRTLRAIVYSKYMPLQPLIAESPECIPIMTRQIIGCLYDLREKANILHRDVSLQNIMYTYSEEELYFVLIDFDMATIVSKDDDATYKPSSKHRTGTLPFMAADLIDSASKYGTKNYVPVAHFVRHDVESVFWVSLWGPMVLMEPENDDEKAAKDTNIKVARAWETADLQQIALNKIGMRKQWLAKSKITLIGKAKCLHGWFIRWLLFWIRVSNALDAHEVVELQARENGLPPPPLDHETLNDSFTRETIMEGLFKSAIQMPSIVLDNETTGAPTRQGPRIASVELDASSSNERKVTVMKKSPAPSRAKEKAAKKTSTIRVKAAVDKVKPMLRRTTVRSRRAKDPATGPKRGEQENVNGANIRARLRPRKQVNYKC